MGIRAVFSRDEGRTWSASCAQVEQGRVGRSRTSPE